MRAIWILLGAILVPLAGCASVPSFDRALDRISATAPPPRIVGVRGPLSVEQSKAIIDRIGNRAGRAGMLQRHLATERAIADTPLVAGNRTRVLRNGPETFPAIFKAIHDARRSVNMEYYIIEDVESDGEYLSDLLVAKRRQGIAVNIIYDSFGSLGTSDDFFEKLEKAGVRLLAFHPVNPFEARGDYSLNDRDHRKLLVVDGRIGIVGGINLSTTYESNRLSFPRFSGMIGRSGGSDADAQPGDHERWRDTDLEIEGPVVAQLQRLFVAHWMQSGGSPLDTAGFFPEIGKEGDEIVRIIGSSPDDPLPRYYVTLLSAMRNAERSIWLSASYFVPTREIMDTLKNAARRGIDVRLMLPDHSDSAPAIAVARSSYGELLEAGVKIFETHGIFLHSKTVVIDNVWSAIGSSNIDPRSVLYNDEVDAVVLGEHTAGAVRVTLERDLLDSTPIDLATWRDRPFTEKIGEFFAGIMEPLL